jgi:cardiolipin synthase
MGPLSYTYIPSKRIPGNRISLLTDGPEVFGALFGAIDEARTEIALEIYMFKDDATGREVRGALLRALQRGVRVRVIYDDLGSLFTDASFFDPLRMAGGEVAVYHKISVAHPAWRWTKRNHRKMFLRDGDLVIIGGLNIADESSRSPEEGGAHDLAARVEGPAADEAWRIFRRTWKRATARRSRGKEIVGGGGSVLKGSQGAEIVGNDHWLDRWKIRRRILYALSQARESVVLTNPYFLPDPAILHALTRAARKGVRVRIVLPSRTDVGILDLASTVVVKRLIRCGVEVYRWPGFTHGKAIVIDRSWISIGSANFDYRSLFHNLEVVVQSEDPLSGEALCEILTADIGRSRRVGSDEWGGMPPFKRWMARLFYRLRAFL